MSYVATYGGKMQFPTPKQLSQRYSDDTAIALTVPVQIRLVTVVILFTMWCGCSA